MRTLEFRDYDPTRESHEDALLIDDLFQNVSETLEGDPDFQVAAARAILAPRDLRREFNSGFGDRPVSEVVVEYVDDFGNPVKISVNNVFQQETTGRRWTHKMLDYKVRGLALTLVSDYMNVNGGLSRSHVGEVIFQDASGTSFQGREAIIKASEYLPELGIEVPIYSASEIDSAQTL